MDVQTPTTDRARQVLTIAGEFARDSRSSTVEAEHLLFALAAEGRGVAAHTLRSMGVDALAIRACLERLSPASCGEVSRPEVGIDQLLRWAQEELKPLGHSYIGTEHLLLALTHVSSGRCSAAMAALRLAPRQIREEVYSILGYVV
jgi:ATP-dependent Clp protease ATP-binding subunit ClpC